MANRVKQVISALTATITETDRVFVSRYLREAEQRLFWGMNLPDQRHVLNVAYTALRLAKEYKEVNRNLLVKCALLHDVGKIKGDVSTADKIITVIGHRLAPKWAKGWGRLGRGNSVMNLRHAFHIYFHHAKRSAAMLKAIGTCPSIIEIVARHHEKPSKQDCLELLLLRQADDLH